jgi:hypothetical protein
MPKQHPTYCLRNTLVQREYILRKKKDVMRGHLFYVLTNARQMKFIGKIDMIILL